MSVPGLSLVGFFDSQEDAHRYLDQRCLFPGHSQSALLAEWHAARQRLGPPHPKPGMPNVESLPAALSGHLDRVRLTGDFEEVEKSFADLDFALVEIAPLLAFQFHVETGRAQALCESLPADPDPAQLAELCLPATAETYRPQISANERSVTILSQSLNLRIIDEGLFQDDGAHQIAGIHMGMTGPFVQVAEFEGRYFLRNGYHRAYALQKAGVEYMPALLVHPMRFELTGVIGAPSTFGREILTSDNPPTCSHYTDEKALPVALRRPWKVINVSWSEDIFLEP